MRALTKLVFLQITFKYKKKKSENTKIYTRNSEMKSDCVVEHLTNFKSYKKGGFWGPRQQLIICKYWTISCPLTRGHGDRVVTLSPPTSEAGVSVPGTASSGKAGSCLPLVGSLQYRTLTNCMYWFPLPFQLPVVI